VAKLIGDAAFEWFDPDDDDTATHPLRVPLARVRPAYRLNRYVAESENLSTREVIVTGTVYEAVGMVRYDDDPASLAKMVRAGARGVTLTYYPDYTAGTPSIALQLIEPGEVWAAALDEYPAAFREYTAELRFRRTDGSAFPDWFFES
jgi:hypothetical protein